MEKSIKFLTSTFQPKGWRELSKSCAIIGWRHNGQLAKRTVLFDLFDAHLTELPKNGQPIQVKAYWDDKRKLFIATEFRVPSTLWLKKDDLLILPTLPETIVVMQEKILLFANQVVHLTKEGIKSNAAPQEFTLGQFRRFVEEQSSKMFLNPSLVSYSELLCPNNSLAFHGQVISELTALVKETVGANASIS